MTAWLTANWHWVLITLAFALFVVSLIGNLVMDEMDAAERSDDE